MDPTTSEEDRRGAINNIYTHTYDAFHYGFTSDKTDGREGGGEGSSRRKREREGVSTYFLDITRTLLKIKKKKTSGSSIAFFIREILWFCCSLYRSEMTVAI